MKRATVISCVYPPEPVVSAGTSRDVAEALAAAGYAVTVLAPYPSRPGGRLFDGYSRRPWAASRDGAVRVVRVGSTVSKRSTMASRLAENVTFGLASAAQLLVRRRPDVLYVNTWPVVAAGLVALVAHVRRIPFVLSLQDVYPESLVAQGRTRANSALARVMRAIDGTIARSAAGVIAISSEFASEYRKTRRLSAGAVHVVPNWRSDTEDPRSGADGPRLREALGIDPDAFLVVYAGNIGRAAGVEQVIEALRNLDSDSPVHLLIAGEGSELEACRRLAASVAPGRVHFLSPWHGVGPLAAADVFVLPTAGEQSLASVPSKLITYLLAGRPVIATALAGSATAAAVAEAGAGWVVLPDDAPALASRLSDAAASSPAERARMGEEGRRYALARFTRDACAPRVLDALVRAAAR